MRADVRWSLVVPFFASACGSQGLAPGRGNVAADGGASLDASDASVRDGAGDGPTQDGAAIACNLPDHPPTPACGAPACGNGVRDSCASCCPTAGTPGGAGGTFADAGCSIDLTACTLQETCDRTDLGTNTCMSLGFSGGTLACTSVCSLDTNGCTTCLSDPHSLACLNAPVAANTPSTLALATTDEDIVIAWVAGPGPGGDDPGVAGTVRVARFGADLSLVEQFGCIGPAHAERVAIARSTTGYILAISGDGGITIQPLDSTGAPRGSQSVVSSAEFPMLAAQEQGGTVGGGPLLAWSVYPPTTPSAAGLEMKATILDDSGKATFAPVTVFAVTVQQPRGNYNAVFTGDAFLVAAEASTALVARLAPDGTVTTPSAPAGLGVPEYPRLAWTGTQAQLVFLDTGQTPLVSRMVSLDEMGNPLGPPIALSGSIYFPPPVLALGQDVVVVFGTGGDIIDQDSHLSVTRVSATGTQVTAPFGVVSDPQGLYQPSLALRGTDVVLAWVGGGYPGRIGLARLAP